MVELDIQVKLNKDISAGEYAAIIALCSQAFKRDYTSFMGMFMDPTHVLGRYQGELVSYVLWITRWLQMGRGPLMRTAYIEGLATELSHRNKGFASQVMKRAAAEIQDFDIAALSTGSIGFYKRLNWQLWQGPLFIRKDNELVPTPEEQGVMVLPLPKTPSFSLYNSLSIEWRKVEPW
jgi:aminoglycoside 2'-N-acetyltransferase I